ncbi:hypothetical protein QP028_11080 [Corynebacterium suedekumii]|nr:hypothetical protein QP028_11080 [Corynebacterium suedekumii]
MTSQYLTYSEAAKRYQISTRRLMRLTEHGHLTRHKSIRDSRRTLLSVTELDAMFREAATA